MLTLALETALVDLIQERIKNQDTFTAFDLTRELRAEGYRVLHDNARNFVHAYYQTGSMTGYTRELRVVSLNGARAWTYYPEPPAPDPGSLLAPSSMRTYNLPVPVSQGAPPPPPDPDPTPAPTGGGICRRKDNPLIKGRDPRKRLYIPKNLLSQIGLRAGDTAWTSYHDAHGPWLNVSPYHNAHRTIQAHKIDHHGGCYISNRTLQKAQLDFATLKITAHLDYISVEEP